MLFSYLCCCCRFCCSLSCQFCCWNFYFFLNIVVFVFVLLLSLLFLCLLLMLFSFCRCCYIYFIWLNYYKSVFIFFLHVKNYTCINTLQCWIDIYVNFFRYGIHITKLLLYIRSAFYVISNKIMQKETLMRDNTRAKS